MLQIPFFSQVNLELKNSLIIHKSQTMIAMGKQ